MNSMRMLPTRACDIFGHRFHFRPSKIIRYECVFVLILFQERFQMDAFLMKTLGVLVWTEGLKGWKCVRFQTQTQQCAQGLILTIKSKNGLTIRPESRLFGFLWVRLGIAERSEKGRESLLPGLLPTASFELHYQSWKFEMFSCFSSYGRSNTCTF